MLPKNHRLFSLPCSKLYGKFSRFKLTSLTFGITSTVCFFLVWRDELWAGGLFCSECGLVRFPIVPLPSTALASFPGSGNTWVRSLIQDTTGYLTGSEYLDEDLLHGGFLGEGVGAPSPYDSGSKVLMVKTHNSDEATLSRFQRAILLVRNPKEAILSEFNRLYGGGHQKRAALDMFQRYWTEFSLLHVNAWRSFHSDWLRFPGNLLVIFYSDLVARPAQELKRILNFLKLTLTSTDARINCAVCRAKHLRRPELEYGSRNQFYLFLKDDFTSAVEMYYTIKENMTVSLQP